MSYKITLELMGKEKEYSFENVIMDGNSPDTGRIEMYFIQLENGERIEIPKHNIALIKYSLERYEKINQPQQG